MFFFNHIRISGTDVDVLLLPASGSIENIVQLRDGGEWQNEDAEVGSRLYARVKDVSPTVYLALRMGGVDACHLDLQSGNNQIFVVEV